MIAHKKTPPAARPAAGGTSHKDSNPCSHFASAARAVGDGVSVFTDGPHFVFLHRGREIHDCWPLDADDCREIAEQLRERHWFTASHEAQFAALARQKFGGAQ